MAIRPYVSRQVWAMIELQRLTGMRPGEVVLMRTSDLDMGRDVWVYSPGRHKTEHHGKTREVFIGPRGQEVLRAWLRAEREAYLFSPLGCDARSPGRDAGPPQDPGPAEPG